MDFALESAATLEFPVNHKAVFFATPENRTAIDVLRAKYPGGVYGIMLRKSKPQEILFEYYILNP
jgi:hypothetical protein